MKLVRCKSKHGRALLLRKKSYARELMSTSWLEAAREALGTFRGPTTMLSPCCGLETALMAWQVLRPDACPKTWSWEVDTDLQGHIRHVHAAAGGHGVAYIGKQGDFEAVDLTKLNSAQFLCAGPPCPPFSRSGRGCGWHDPRAKVFMKVLLAIKELALRPDGIFEAFCIENVSGMDDKKADCENTAVEDVMLWLSSALQAAETEWHVWSWKVNTSKCGLPQNRDRNFMCGRKASEFTHAIPRTSPSSAKIQQVNLKQILDADLPSEVASLKPVQKANLDSYIAQIEKVRTRHRMADVNQIAIFDLGRAEGKKRPMNWRADGKTMCLTCRNCYLWAQGYGPDMPKYGRYITAAERAQVQGFPAETSRRLKQSRAAQVRAIGNAMAFPVVGLVMSCMFSDHR